MAPAAGGGGNVFTRKLGPLPMWGWTAGAGVLVVGWAVYQRRKASTTAASSSTAGSSALTPPQVTQIYDTTQVTTPPEQDHDTDDGHTPDHHHRRHHHRPGVPPRGEEHETPLVARREKGVGEYGSAAYRKKYGKDWKRTR